MKETKPSREGLLFAHQDVANRTRAIANFLIEKLAENTNDESKFSKLIQQSDRASLTLQRLSSILTNIIPLEHNLLERQIEIAKRSPNNRRITRQDCEIVISLARGWGLLRDGCDDDIEKVIDMYETKKDEDL